MVKPDAVGNMGQVVQAVEAAGFIIRCSPHLVCSLRGPCHAAEAAMQPVPSILHSRLAVPLFGCKLSVLTAKPATLQPLLRSQMRLCKLNKAEVEQFYAVHRGKPFYERLTAFMSSRHVLAMELVAEGKNQTGSQDVILRGLYDRPGRWGGACPGHGVCGNMMGSQLAAA